MVQFSYPYITTGKTIALTRWTFDGKVMFLPFNNTLSRLVITFLKRSKRLNFAVAITVPEKAMTPTPVFLPGKSHGWRRLVGCSPWGR